MKRKQVKKKQKWLDEEIDDDVLSSDEEDLGRKRKPILRNEDSEEVFDKRTRLAKELINRITNENKKGDDDELDDEEDNIDRELRKEVLSSQGRVLTSYASKFAQTLSSTTESIHKTTYRSIHNESITAVCLSSDEKNCFSGSKDGTIVNWDIELNKLKWTPKKIPKTRILSLASSSDGRYLASCGDKKGSMIRIWDLRENSLEPVKTFSGHRDVVNGVCFRQGTHVLLSSSDDRSVRVWNASEGSFIENLFGHQGKIFALDCLSKERCVTSSDDLSVRLWKIPEETHLTLSGKHYGPIDCVKMLNEGTYISGSQDGNIALWTMTKRRPVSVITNAHGHGRWVESLSCIKHSDVFASGSEDGLIKLWKVDLDKLKIDPEPLAALPCEGHVNSIALGSSILVAGVGREPRLGRWRVHESAKNAVHIFKLPNVSE